MGETKKIVDSVVGGLRPRPLPPLGRVACKACGEEMDLGVSGSHRCPMERHGHERLVTVADEAAVSVAEGGRGEGSAG